MANIAAHENQGESGRRKGEGEVLIHPSSLMLGLMA